MKQCLYCPGPEGCACNYEVSTTADPLLKEMEELPYTEPKDLRFAEHMKDYTGPGKTYWVGDGGHNTVSSFPMNGTDVTVSADKAKEFAGKQISTQPHYPKDKSLFKIGEELGLNGWEIDIFRRLVRCRHKGEWKKDLNKIKDTVDIYLKEYENS